MRRFRECFEFGDGTIWNGPKLSWQLALDLEARAECVTRVREEYFILHVEIAEGKLQVCASHQRERPFEADEHEHQEWALTTVLALLDWN